MTLENKWGLTSSAGVTREEERIGKKKVAEFFDKEILDNLPVGKYSALQAIHKYLFEDIYNFAGELRTVNIAKGNFRFASLIYSQATLESIDKMSRPAFGSTAS